MKALIDLDNAALLFNEFGNYYGNLAVFKKGDKYSMGIANYTGYEPTDIPDYLFEALMKYADTLKDREKYHGGVQVYDLSTEEGVRDLESSY